MKIAFHTADGHAVGLADILGPVIDLSQNGELSVGDLVAHVHAQVAAGALVMTPSGASIEQMIIGTVVREYLATSVEKGARRFVSDRAGYRIDRRNAMLVRLADERRAQYAQAVRGFLFDHGPAMFRSQAKILLLLDPTTNVRDLANQCGQKVHDAVLEADAGSGPVSENPEHTDAA